MTNTFEFVRQFGLSLDHTGRVEIKCKWSDYLCFFQTPQMHSIALDTTIYAADEKHISVILYIPVEEFWQYLSAVNS